MTRPLMVIGAITLVLTSACGNRNTGGYYSNDGPPDDTEVAAAIQPTPVANLPLAKTGNDPYEVFGQNYFPRKSVEEGYSETGIASWYGTKFHGKRTSSGEPYDMMQFTAAHKTLPLPTFVRVTSLDTKRSVIVKVNDRGPFLKGRVIDLSYVAAKRLGIAAKGTGRVRIDVIESLDYQPDKPQTGTAIAAAQPLEVQSLAVEPLNPNNPNNPNNPQNIKKINVSSTTDAAVILPSATNTAQGTETPAVVLERKVVRTDGYTTEEPATTKLAQLEPIDNGSLEPRPMTTSDDEIVLPSVPDGPTGSTSPLQTGPVVSIESIVRSTDYFIQAGAFRDRDNAYDIYYKLLRRGYSSRILSDSEGLYRVQIGPYATEMEASATMGMLRAAGEEDVRLVKPEQ